MLVVIGASLLSVGIVLFQWAYIEHHRRSPKSWTEPEYVAHTISLIVTSLLAFGIGLIVGGVLHLEGEPLSAKSAVAVAAIVGALVVAVTLLYLWWLRLRAAVESPKADVHRLHVAANDSSSGMPPRRGAARARRRKAA